MNGFLLILAYTLVALTLRQWKESLLTTGKFNPDFYNDIFSVIKGWFFAGFTLLCGILVLCYQLIPDNEVFLSSEILGRFIYLIGYISTGGILGYTVLVAFKWSHQDLKRK